MKGLATILAAATLWTGVAAADTDATRAVWARHVEAATSGDLDAVMADFTERSAIITPEAVISGTAAIRAFFEDYLGGLTPAEVAGAVVNAEIAHDDVMVYNFTIGGSTFHDTAVIRDDQILMLSTASYPAD
jgi:SnoaL-like protein